MRSWSILGLVVSSFVVACNGIEIRGPADDDAPDPAEEVVDESVVAGANQNDRGRPVDGEDLRTGAMVTSPSGRFIVMQRNTQTVLFEAAARRYHELPTTLLRVAFAKSSDIAFAHSAGGMFQAIDLSTRAPLWTLRLPSGSACSMLRVSPDDATLVIGDGAGVVVVDARTGSIRKSTTLPSPVTYGAFVPGEPRALVVGRTVWRDGGPHTPVYGIDLSGASASLPTIDVPNCEAPIAVTPDGRRAFLSPTYCSPGARAVPGQVWTNPDPVSVIELAGGALSFRKNLPGFGPVTMSTDGRSLIAYLDVKRMDASMFDDPDQVPWRDGQRYHLMTIDPATLEFALAPIGNAIPRFALTADGRGLLVDASTKASSRTKMAARVAVEVGADGVSLDAETNLDVFGSSAAFGYFELASQKFTPFNGPRAPLDRFVQLANGRYVVTLETRADGAGGTPYLIDLAARSTLKLESNYGRGVRDIGLSADGAFALVRIRLPASVHDGGYYSREALCISRDGTCGATFDASFEASTPFDLVPPPPPEEPQRDPYLDCRDASEC